MFSFETRRIRVLSFVCLAVLSLLLVLLIGSYYVSNRKLLAMDTEKSLMFVAEINSQAVSMRVQEPLKLMSVVASCFAETDSPSEVVELLLRQDETGLFADFTWIWPDLSYHTTVQKELVLELTGTLELGFGGSPYIAYTPSSPVTGRPAILYGVPVLSGGEVRAVVVGSSLPERFTEYAFMDTFAGQGSSYIIDRNGTVVAHSANARDVAVSDNLFDFLVESSRTLSAREVQALRDDLLEGRIDTVLYTGEDSQRLMYYRPLSVDGWFLLSAAPLGFVTSHYAKHAAFFAVVCVLVILAFGLAISSIINRSGQYRNSLEAALYTDPVTGGMSYVKFERLARERLHEAAPNEYTFISLDIHSFKLINDINGGGGGNATLMHMYGVLKNHLDRGDLMCRVDADIFNCLVRTRPVAELARLFSDFTDDLNRFNDNKQNKYYLRIKAGFYTIPDRTVSFMAIRDRSNIARKMAKNQQSAKLFTYDVFEESVLLRQTKEREFENMMGQSLQNHEFKMYLQPKINIQTGKVAGAEALVRWESPVYGTIRPDSFIPMFERNGFIVQIDLNVFEQACEFLRARLDAGSEPVHISVNLSRAHLYNPDFMRDFVAIREQYQVPASLLEFEITESMAFEQLDFMATFIKEIHNAGFTCSIDDFGSGYSSLNALSDIPADTLKLDRAFFKVDSHEKLRNKQIIASVISLAKKLDMKVVAEGIETSSQAHFLQDIDCDIIQGFIYSRPLPVPAFEAFLETWSEENVCQPL